MADLAGIDPDRVRALQESENARFVDERPRSMKLWACAPVDATGRADGVPMPMPPHYAH